MSYCCLKYHIIFSTKERRPRIAADLVPRLSEYIGGICRGIGCVLERANGPADHLHLAISASAKTALAECVKIIKTNSSKWMHETFPDQALFGWQDGYAAFTVAPSVMAKLFAYIDAQLEHHQKLTFEEELAELLKCHGIAHDSRYLLG